MTSPVIVPIPAADALYVDALRVALHCYERGDYQRAANLFQDAAALAGYRPEALAFAELGAALETALKTRALVSRDAAFASAAEVRG
jgi:hypothetical protein